MFDFAYSELLMIAAVALVVIGPKDLPKALRVMGQWVGKGRAMTRHVRAGFDEMMRQAEIEEMEKQWRDHNAKIMAAAPKASDFEIQAVQSVHSSSESSPSDTTGPGGSAGDAITGDLMPPSADTPANGEAAASTAPAPDATSPAFAAGDQKSQQA